MTKDEFIREFKTDPYTSLITRMHCDAWAMGYEAARREIEEKAADERGVIKSDHPYAELCALLRRSSGSELRNRAAKDLIEQQCEAEQKMILALAATAPAFVGLHPGSNLD